MRGLVVSSGPQTVRAATAMRVFNLATSLGDARLRSLAITVTERPAWAKLGAAAVIRVKAAVRASAVLNMAVSWGCSVGRRIRIKIACVVAGSMNPEIRS